MPPAADRPPVEKWSREELEDQFHNILEQFRAAQNRAQLLEKKIVLLNGKVRRFTIGKDDAIDKDKYDKLLHENQLLTMKLKSAKHQLLTYTTPSARPGTALAMTSRSTFRPVSAPTNRRPPSSAVETTRGEIPQTNRQPTVNDTAIAEKANVIRLNRVVREKNGLISELREEIEQLTQQVTDLTEKLENPQTPTETPNLPVDKSELEMIKKELDIARNEKEVLMKANERLVEQSLSHTVEQIDDSQHQEEIKALEIKLRAVQKKEREAVRQLKQERKSIEEIKKRNKSEKRRTPQSPTESSIKERKITFDPHHSDVLSRLYRDVTSILESHNENMDDTFSIDGAVEQKNIKWQALHAELYDELEKVRNLLLIQHNINQKQASEITILQEESDRIKTIGEERLSKLKDQLSQKHKKIQLLEEQLRLVAYSGQKAITNVQEKEISGLSTQLFLKLSRLALEKNIGASVFLSLEFFDFELQTTPLLAGIHQPLDFTCVYDIVVSQLFMHYIRTDGITVELYSPQGASYQLLGAGVISLRQLIVKKSNRLMGELVLKSISSGATLATLSYEISLTNMLTEALQAYKRAEAAQSFIAPVEIPQETGWNELEIRIIRCSGDDCLSRDLSIAYEFLSFSMYFTKSTTTGEWNTMKKWPIPDEGLQYFDEHNIVFYLIDNQASGSQESVLGMLLIPLAALGQGRIVRGSYPMLKADGSSTNYRLEIYIQWLKPLKAPETPLIPMPSQSQQISPSTSSLESPPRIEQEEHSISPRPSSSSVSSAKSEVVEENVPEIPIPAQRHGSPSSTDSGGTFTKEKVSEEIEETSSPMLSPEASKSTPRNDFLSDLPPIARPRMVHRLSRTSSELSSGRTASHDEPQYPHEQRRTVEFSSPLHHSVPPSETSSTASPRVRPPVPLPNIGGRSAIKLSHEAIEDYGSDAEDGALVSVHISRLYNMEMTPLTSRRYDGARLYVDWKFLDFPIEDCRVLESQPLSDDRSEPIVFDFTQEYHLSRRRIALLEQHVELQTRLEFCLVTDNGVDSEELAVGLMDLARVPSHEPVTLSIQDVSGVRYGELDIILYYSPDIFELLER